MATPKKLNRSKRHPHRPSSKVVSINNEVPHIGVNFVHGNKNYGIRVTSNSLAVAVATMVLALGLLFYSFLTR